MPQGKIKTKSNKPVPKKKQGVVKNKGITKKGSFKTVPKKAAQFEKFKFQKAVSKAINSKIETDIKATAIKQGEGKALKIINSGEGTSKN